ncbi:MAG: hypothetical protein KDE51_16315 [Anaerolineales bacterium]|nr:hypothetical protein [Anaerolineales bacterium]
MIRRILGFVIALTGVAGILISTGIYIYGQRAVDATVSQTVNTLTLATDTLDTTRATLLVAKDSINGVSDTLDTVESTAVNLSQTVTQSKPLIDQIGSIATEEIPNSLETIEGTIPNIVSVAGTVDDTLTILSSFGFERNLDYGLIDLGTLSFDLGIDYDPEVRFDESIEQLGTSIEGLPEQLRTLDIYLNVTKDNLDTISTDIVQLSNDIAAIDDSLSATPELIDDYIAAVTEVQDGLRQTRTQIEQQTETAKMILLGIAVWFALIHLTPLYLGLEMIFGKRKEVIVEQMVVRESGEGDHTETDSDTDEITEKE